MGSSGGLARAAYAAIQRDVDVPVLSCLHLGLLAARHPGVPPDTLAAIFAQENQHKVIRSHHIHKAAMPVYCNRYLAGEDLLDLCGAVDFPPCLMMRRLLEALLRLSKQRVSDVLKQPELLADVDARAALDAWCGQQAPEQQQQQQQHDEQQQQQWRSGGVDPVVLLARLQADVVRCTLADRSYSPFCDMAKSLAGLEHEARLYACLAAAGVPFWREAELRARGLFKTPDALLQVPVAMRGDDGCWHIVHWLDSKAGFGDERSHRQAAEGQYATYVNRYGSGCVIYWQGFITDLAATNNSSTGQQQQQQQHQQHTPPSGQVAATYTAAPAGERQQQQPAVSNGGSSGGGGSLVVSSDVHLRDNFPGPADILRLPQLTSDPRV